MSLFDSAGTHAFLLREKHLPVSACNYHYAFAVPNGRGYFPGDQIMGTCCRSRSSHALSGIKILADCNEPPCLGIITKAPCLIGKLSGASHPVFKVFLRYKIRRVHDMCSQLHLGDGGN